MDLIYPTSWQGTTRQYAHSNVSLFCWLRCLDPSSQGGASVLATVVSSRADPAPGNDFLPLVRISPHREVIENMSYGHGEVSDVITSFRQIGPMIRGDPPLSLYDTPYISQI